MISQISPKVIKTFLTNYAEAGLVESKNAMGFRKVVDATKAAHNRASGIAKGPQLWCSKLTQIGYSSVDKTTGNGDL